MTEGGSEADLKRLFSEVSEDDIQFGYRNGELTLRTLWRMNKPEDELMNRFIEFAKSQEGDAARIADILSDILDNCKDGKIDARDLAKLVSKYALEARSSILENDAAGKRFSIGSRANGRLKSMMKDPTSYNLHIQEAIKKGIVHNLSQKAIADFPGDIWREFIESLDDSGPS
ncbi:hypothetical protein [Streptomyces sp. NPDC047981]|uniref:hypothetical protein n=1 Tax=Streptomyces sp. NPDC047981 TaxID=3154610 RepID=UPI00342CAEEA